MLTGDNGLINQTIKASKQTDITGTREQIEIELMSRYDTAGNYTNDDVIEAVTAVTGEEVEEGTETVTTAKGNDVDISDLWKAKEDIRFMIGMCAANASSLNLDDEYFFVEFSAEPGTTWDQFWDEIKIRDTFAETYPELEHDGVWIGALWVLDCICEERGPRWVMDLDIDTYFQYGANFWAMSCVHGDGSLVRFDEEIVSGDCYYIYGSVE